MRNTSKYLNENAMQTNEWNTDFILYSFFRIVEEMIYN